jgi:uncharacterized protein YcbX
MPGQQLPLLVHRCKVTTMDPETGLPGEGEPLDLLSTFRRGSDLSYKTKAFKFAVFFCWNLVASQDAYGQVLMVGDQLQFEGVQQQF